MPRWFRLPGVLKRNHVSNPFNHRPGHNANKAYSGFVAASGAEQNNQKNKEQ